MVDLGTLTDEYEKEISIHTTATGKDGEKSIVAGKEVTIVDTVTLDGLEKGTKYQLKGWQMLKEENAELIQGQVWQVPGHFLLRCFDPCPRLYGQHGAVQLHW